MSGAFPAAIWHSFRRLPGWVQFWVGAILVPVNLFALAFLTQPGGLWVAALACGGMLPNIPVVLIERGFSRAMALPHALLWTPLVGLVGWQLAAGPDLVPLHARYLGLLLAVDLVSLAFDYRDAVRWWRGERDIA